MVTGLRDRLNTSSSTPETANAPPRGWLDARPCLRRDLVIDVRQSTVVIEDPIRSKFYQVGHREYELLSRFTGEKSVEALLNSSEVSQDDAESGDSTELTQSTDTRNDWENSDIVQVARWASQNGLLTSESSGGSKPLRTRAAAVARQKRAAMLNPISIKLTLFNPDRLLATAQPWFEWLFSRWFLTAWIVMAIVAGYTMATNWDQAMSASTGILSNYRWLPMLVAWFVLKVMHEFAHGIACRRYGGEVPEAGVLFLLFTPMAYVNVTSMWRMPRRWHRIVVAAAGMYVELFVSFIAVVVWSQSDGFTQDIAWQVFLMASLTTLLFNANPLMRFDGYFVLSDVLGIVNLYPKGVGWVSKQICRICFGMPVGNLAIPKDERLWVIVYGVLAWCWKITVSVGLMIAAAVMLNGIGILIAGLAGWMWFVQPILREIYTVAQSRDKHAYSLSRIGTTGFVTASIFTAAFFVLQGPGTRSAPGIVRFRDATAVHCQTDGTVTSIAVQSGDQVSQGDLLAVLENDELAVEMTKVRSEIETARIRARMHRQKAEISQYQTQQDLAAALEQQLSDLLRQHESLTIVAPVSGTVMRRNLDALQGNYVRRGDTLLEIADVTQKEVLVSLDQRDLESLRHQDNPPVRILLPGQPVIRSAMERLDPRASTIPVDQRLCAPAGGPIDVRQSPGSLDSDRRPASEFELLTPRLVVHVPLEEANAKDVWSGQRCTMFFTASNQSLGAYLWISTQDWLTHQIEQATAFKPF